MPKETYCIGFTTTKGLMLDLDNISFKGCRRLADYYLTRYKLEGYLLIQTAKKNFHLVFNRYLTWNTIIQIVFTTNKAIAWGVWQARKGELTLRVSSKSTYGRPKILIEKGNTDKLIKDYLEVYNMFKEF